MPAEWRQRIDKWLWHAHFARTRTAAQKLALSGSVRVNRGKVEAVSDVVRAGDVLTIGLRSGVRVVRVEAMHERRGPAVDARALYNDLSPPSSVPPPGGARVANSRPTKRDRRRLDALKESKSGPDEDFPDEV